jgi:hypothetical protein
MVKDRRSVIGTAIGSLWPIVVESAISNNSRRLAAIPNSTTTLTTRPRIELRAKFGSPFRTEIWQSRSELDTQS